MNVVEQGMLLIALSMGVIAGPAMTPIEEGCAPPKRLRAGIGGSLGPSYWVEIDGARLTYSTREPGQHTATASTVEPTPQQWCEFRQALDRVGVWGWRSDYENLQVLDGTHWELDVAYQDRAVRARGDNDYPSDFQSYQLAVERLLGGRTFR